MTRRQVDALADSIHKMKGTLPDAHRLLFAQALRPFIDELASDSYPDYRTFLAQCGLDQAKLDKERGRGE